MKGALYRILRALPVILTVIWCGVIFAMSAKNADVSGNMSGTLAAKIAVILIPGFSDMSQTGQLAYIDMADHIVRKCAHFAEYAILGMLLATDYRVIKGKEASGRASKNSVSEAFGRSGGVLPVIVPFVIGALYAASDEWHQTFVPGRSGQVTDVVLDSAGVMTGVMLLLLTVKATGGWRSWGKEKE